MQIDHGIFFDRFKAAFDPHLEQSQVDGIEFLLKSFEAEPLWDDLRHIAYALATIAHETNFSFQPVEEGYYLAKYGQARVKSFQKSLRYYPYFGRGFVQLTWKSNYIKAGKALGIDLVDKPELALQPEAAFQVMTLGMHSGWFAAGQTLAKYIHDDECDYAGARHIINGTDKAEQIAGYARKFEAILKATAGQVPAPDATPPATGTTGSTTVVEQKGDTTQQTTVEVKNEQDVNQAADVQGGRPYLEKGFLSIIKSDLAKIGLGVSPLATLASWREQIVQLGIPMPPPNVMLTLVIIAGSLAVAYLLARFIHFIVWTHRENKRVEIEALVNSAINRKDINWK